MPVCPSCNDTHRLVGEDHTWPCTACPVPCQKCRAGGYGAYCETTPCSCPCHTAKAGPVVVSAVSDAMVDAFRRGVAKCRITGDEVVRAGLEEVLAHLRETDARR